eukprot:snap_masked-scaffold_3-processed-gene-9.34-mRNA-1 protein AED:1.00 eAED:1.00 QI:0/0/0/0/1/1/2/0/61
MKEEVKTGWFHQLYRNNGVCLCLQRRRKHDDLLSFRSAFFSKGGPESRLDCSFHQGVDAEI